MATSGTTAYTITGDEIIQLALGDIGALALGETPTDDEYSDARKRLNLFLKSLQTKFKIVSNKAEATFSTVADTVSYTLDAGIDEIEDIWLEVDGSVIPLDVHVDKQIIYTGVTGMPSDVFVDESSDPYTLYMYPVPDAVYTVHYQKVSLIESLTAGTQEIDLPLKFIEMLQKGMAYRLSYPYRLPLEERMLLKSEYTLLEKEALADNTARSGNEIVVPAFVV